MDGNQRPQSKGVHQEFGQLRDQIRQFADTLQLFENGTDIPNAEETIETLRGISLGAFSCAELLTKVTKKSSLASQAGFQREKTLDDQIKTKADETLQCCAALSTSLRSLKKILRVTPAADLEDMEQTSRRVQAALSNIAAEWEDL